MILNRYLKYFLLVLLMFSFASCSLTPKEKKQTSTPWEEVASEKAESEVASRLNLLNLFFSILLNDVPPKVESDFGTLIHSLLASKNSPIHLHSGLSPPLSA